MKPIKTAREILREMEVSGNYGNETINNWIVDTDEDHVVNAMIVYASQFIDLAAEKARVKKCFTTFYDVDRLLILNIKQLIQ